MFMSDPGCIESTPLHFQGLGSAVAPQGLSQNYIENTRSRLVAVLSQNVPNDGQDSEIEHQLNQELAKKRLKSLNNLCKTWERICEKYENAKEDNIVIDLRDFSLVQRPPLKKRGRKKKAVTVEKQENLILNSESQIQQNVNGLNPPKKRGRKKKSENDQLRDLLINTSRDNPLLVPMKKRGRKKRSDLEQVPLLVTKNESSVFKSKRGRKKKNVCEQVVSMKSDINTEINSSSKKLLDYEKSDVEKEEDFCYENSSLEKQICKKKISGPSSIAFPSLLDINTFKNSTQKNDIFNIDHTNHSTDVISTTNYHSHNSDNIHKENCKSPSTKNQVDDNLSDFDISHSFEKGTLVLEPDFDSKGIVGLTIGSKKNVTQEFRNGIFVVKTEDLEKFLQESSHKNFRVISGEIPQYAYNLVQNEHSENMPLPEKKGIDVLSLPKKRGRKKKNLVPEPQVEIPYIPKKRGRKKKVTSIEEQASVSLRIPKKRGRKKKITLGEQVFSSPLIPKKRGRKKRITFENTIPKISSVPKKRGRKKKNSITCLPLELPSDSNKLSRKKKVNIVEKHAVSLSSSNEQVFDIETNSLGGKIIDKKNMLLEPSTVTYADIFNVKWNNHNTHSNFQNMQNVAEIVMNKKPVLKKSSSSDYLQVPQSVRSLVKDSSLDENVFYNKKTYINYLPVCKNHLYRGCTNNCMKKCWKNLIHSKSHSGSGSIGKKNHSRGNMVEQRSSVNRFNHNVYKSTNDENCSSDSTFSHLTETVSTGSYVSAENSNFYSCYLPKKGCTKSCFNFEHRKCGQYTSFCPKHRERSNVYPEDNKFQECLVYDDNAFENLLD